MRIVRFLTNDGRTIFGDDQGDGTATLLLDARGILGPKQDEQARRALLCGKRALIADDDEGIRRVVGATLHKFGCECTICCDGAEAIDAIRDRELDLIVSDIAMPHHNGYEVFAAAKARDEHLPVILITGFGYDPGHVVVRACDEGCDAVLYKPFTPQQLVEATAEAVMAHCNGSARPLVRSPERVRAGRPLVPLTPRDIFCAGRNYLSNLDEPPTTHHDELELFMKPSTALLGPGMPIRLPTSEGVDPDVTCEGELALIIGRTATRVSEAEALDHVFGFTIANDVTARHWQRRRTPMAWMRGKGFDTFCPLGPIIVTPDEIEDVQSLDIITRVNGDVIRRGNTSRMIRSVARLISEISQTITLQPGSVVLTGAPQWVHSDSPTKHRLHPGDEVTVEIGPIGTLSNPVAQA